MLRIAIQLHRRVLAAQKRRELLQHAGAGTDLHVAHHFALKVAGGKRSRFEPRIRLGNHVWLDGMMVLGENATITIGDHCSFRRDTYIGAMREVQIGNHVFGAEGVFITDNNNHPTSPKLRKDMTTSPPNSLPWKWTEHVACAPVLIGDCVWLGRNCMVLKGVTIGEGSIIAAGAVVSKSVPPFSVAAGNPARIVKTLTNDL